MSPSSRRGESLVELIVALVLLEIAGSFALAAALSIERAGRQIAAGSATDHLRWEQYRQAEVAPGCVGSAVPAAVPLPLPPTATRQPLVATVRCGP